MSKLINIVTLGCSKNLVDSEHLMAQLTDNGFEVVHDSNSTNAKIVIINTCGFIGDAKEESVNMILEFIAAKEAGLIEHLFVMGCLSERYKVDLEKEMPEVEQYFGAANLKDIVEYLKGEYNEKIKTERVVTTPKHYAYLKISEGCNWKCGYCAIPLIRGEHKSVPIEELIKEAEKLAEKGVKELIVIAQDTTYYGVDLYGERRLAELLKRLCEIEGIEWVRLHYAYPTNFPIDVLDVIASEPKMCKYLDIPLQHVSDSQLRSMRRGLNGVQSVELMEKIREIVPDIALRTTLIVGYPGETDQDFEELKAFVKKMRFERLGVFQYSEEEGTYAAKELTDDISAEVKEQRAEEIMEIQNEISLENNERKIGTIQKVIVDRTEGDFFIARTQYDSPEVDNEVVISTRKKLEIGAFYDIKIDAAEDYDLYGKL